VIGALFIMTVAALDPLVDNPRGHDATTVLVAWAKAPDARFVPQVVQWLQRALPAQRWGEKLELEKQDKTWAEATLPSAAQVLAPFEAEAFLRTLLNAPPKVALPTARAILASQVFPFANNGDLFLGLYQSPFPELHDVALDLIVRAKHRAAIPRIESVIAAKKKKNPGVIPAREVAALQSLRTR